MDLASLQEPPPKRPRFFRDPARARSPRPSAEAGDERPPKLEASDERPPKLEASDERPPKLEARDDRGRAGPAASPAPAFDRQAFESFVGATVDAEVVRLIQDSCGDSLERAVNMYFDGTYKRLKQEKASLGVSGSARSSSGPEPPAEPEGPVARRAAPRARYVGAFGVEGWATRSGTNIIKHGDVVRIERQKIQPPQPPKAKGSAPPRASTAASRRIDVIVRFTSQSGTEIGRLAKDTANWVSTLMDQNMCEFQGTCVYAPERLRTNDTVFLQLRCSLLKSAFDRRRLQPADDRPAAFFEQSETSDERELRLRQVALVRLLQEVKLQPTAANAAAAAHDGRTGLLRAAEMDERKQADARRPAANGKDEAKADAGAASPPASSDAEEGEELEQDQLDALYKRARCFDLTTPEAEPADTFAMALRPYQKQSLHWMMAKEKDEGGASRDASMHPLWEEYAWPVKDADDKDLPPVHGQPTFYVNPYSGDVSLDFPVQEQHCLGGILADEMGLGKTIQVLSLVHSHRPEPSRRARTTAGGAASSARQLLPGLGLRMAAANSASVLDAPCTTLVVAPMSLLSQWQSEADKASRPGTLKIELYYGNDKSSNLQALCCSGNAPDLVITSYGVVLSEFGSTAARKGRRRPPHNGLFSMHFLRVVLDEAHHIKNRSSKTARACYELAAAHRWVLTGTPIVNRLEDLFSLVRFLGVQPWSNFSFWKTFITVPFESGDFVRALNVVQTVLEPLVMRRTKDMKTPDGQPLVPLPPKHVDIVDVELSREERAVYDYIFNKAKRTLSSNVEAGTVMKAFTTIFAQILRLRQSCCHPVLVRNRDVVADEEEAGAAADAAAGLADDMDLEALIAQFTAATADDDDDGDGGGGAAFGAHALEQIRSEADKECPLCLEEPMEEQLVTGCWHSACKKCLLDLMRHESDRGAVAKCFSCRAPLKQRDLFEVVRHDDDGGGATMGTRAPRISLQRLGANHSSAKVAALMAQLRALRRAHPGIKSVVFSQFTSFLSLLEPALARAHVGFLRLDGSMAQRARAAVLADFQRRRGFAVLLVSLRAGGVGLNLTSAGRVFVMDPWWSFAVEAQAIDRVHRLGQQDEVVVKRFIVKGSVEERMLRIQERKRFIATSLGMMSDEEKKLQRIEDMKELLS